MVEFDRDSEEHTTNCDHGRSTLDTLASKWTVLGQIGGDMNIILFPEESSIEQYF